LIHAIGDRGAGGIEFDQDASEADFRAVFEVLSLTAVESEGHEDTNRRLADRGCQRIRLLPPYKGVRGKSGAEGGEARETRTTLLPVELYQNLVTALQDTTVSICHGGFVRFDEARTSIDGVLHNLEEDAASLFGLSRYERYDAFTFGHSIRVAMLALQLARSLTTDKALLNRVGVAALLHDVGKVNVPFEVLHCKGRLTAEQRAEMEKHPEYGAEILLDHRDCDPMAYTAAFGHHITADHHGYPRTLHEQRLSVLTKIVKICDVYEALTAVRPYKPAMSSIRAFRIMISMKGAFDLPLLRRFIHIIGAYPCGSIIKIGSGEYARVVDQTPLIHKPVFETLTDPDGVALKEDQRRLIDMSEPSASAIEIAGTLLDANLEDFVAAP
jgi:putative nucleotidyltransferase with HDIG domain